MFNNTMALDIAIEEYKIHINRYENIYSYKESLKKNKDFIIEYSNEKKSKIPKK